MVRWARYYSLGYLTLIRLGWTEAGEVVVPAQKLTDNPTIWVKMESPKEKRDANDSVSNVSRISDYIRRS